MRTPVPGRRHTLSRAAARLLLPPAALRAPFLLVRTVTCDSVSDGSHPGRGEAHSSSNAHFAPSRDSTVPAPTTENSLCHSQLRTSERPLLSEPASSKPCGRSRSSPDSRADCNGDTFPARIPYRIPSAVQLCCSSTLLTISIRHSHLPHPTRCPPIGLHSPSGPPR